MLVISRKPSQQIYIGDNVKITLLQVKGNQVRLGIEAPQHVKVLRGELTCNPSDRRGHADAANGLNGDRRDSP